MCKGTIFSTLYKVHVRPHDSDQPYHQIRPGQTALEDNLVKANRVRGLTQNLRVAFLKLSG